jgi:hypothetical protein
MVQLPFSAPGGWFDRYLCLIQSILKILSFFILDSCEARKRENNASKIRASVRVIHTLVCESVFLISSNTEAGVVVYCGQCGERVFPAQIRGFGCGAFRGQPLSVIPAFPHTPYTPQCAHRIHNRSPQNVDNRRTDISQGKTKIIH